MVNRSFVYGAGFALIGLYAWHHWVKPLPAPKGM